MSKSSNNNTSRVKGNLKVSKSDKAALFLLENQGYIGSSSTKLLGFVPIDFDLDSQTIDDNIRPILRKMEKKDIITKVKAFNELNEYISSSDEGKNEDALLSILPYFPRLYSRSAIDPDQKLREAAHRTIYAFTKRLGKKTMSQLKTYFPVWYFGKFDSHKPTASICINGLNDLFPGTKLIDLIKYCQKELFTFFEGRLTVCQNTMAKEPDNVPLYNNCIKFFVDLFEILKESTISDEIASYFEKTNKLWGCFKSCRDSQALNSSYILISKIFKDEKFVKILCTEKKEFLEFLLKHTVLRIGLGQGERMTLHFNSNENWFLSMTLVQALQPYPILEEVIDFGYILERIYIFFASDDLNPMSGAINNLLPFINIMNLTNERYERQLRILFIDLPLDKIKKVSSSDPLFFKYLTTFFECGRFVCMKTAQENKEKFSQDFVQDLLCPAFEMALLAKVEKSIQTVIFSQISSFLTFLEKKQESNNLYAKTYQDLSEKLESLSFKPEVLSDHKDCLIEFCKIIIDNKNQTKTSDEGHKWMKIYLSYISEFFQKNFNSESSLNDYFSIYFYLDEPDKLSQDSLVKIQKFLNTPIERHDVTCLFGWIKMVHHNSFKLSELNYSIIIMLFDTTYQTLSYLSEMEKDFINSLAYFTEGCLTTTAKVPHIRNLLYQIFLTSFTNTCLTTTNPDMSKKSSNRDQIYSFKRKFITLLYPFDNFEIVHYIAKYCLDDPNLFKDDELSLIRKSLLKYLSTLAIQGDLSILKYIDQQRIIITEHNLEEFNILFKRINYSYESRIRDISHGIKRLNSPEVFQNDYFPAIMKILLKIDQESYILLKEDLFNLLQDCIKCLEFLEPIRILWLNFLSEEIMEISKEFQSKFICQDWNTRLLFSNYSMPSFENINKMNVIMRLFVFFRKMNMMDAKFEKNEDNEKFICNLGIIRSWLNAICSIDGAIIEIQNLFPGEESIVEMVNSLWYQFTMSYSLQDLIKLGESLPNKAYQYAWSSTLLVRFLHKTPNEWPLEYKNMFLSISSFKDSTMSLDHLVSVVIPAGLFWKYSSKTSILEDIVKASSTLDPTELSIILLAFTCVSNAASSYSTNFLPLIFKKETPQEQSLFEKIISVNLDEFTSNNFQMLVSYQRIIEASFLLWQPWQWLDWSKTESSTKDNKSKVSIVSLGFRLRQYRPKLNKAQWESILYNIVCWIIRATKDEFSLVQDNIFAISTFRCLASIGALFLEPATLPSLWLDEILINDPKKNVFSILNDDSDDVKCRNLVHANFDFDNSSDSEDDLSEIEAAIEAISDEEEPENKNSPRKEAEAKKIFNYDDSEDEIDDENENIDSDFTALDENVAIPRRIRPPMHARKDWASFFVANIFPPLILRVLKTCLPLEKSEEIDGSVIKSLCAALGTCPIGCFYSTIQSNMSLFKNHIGYNSVYLNFTTDSTSQDFPEFCFDDESLSKYKRNPDIDCFIDFAAILMTRSKYLAGQMLGHNLLTRLISCISISGKRLSEYLMANMSRILLMNLSGNFSGNLKNKLHLYDDESIINWGRNGSQARWSNEEHQQLIGYLFTWDCIVSIFSSSKARIRSKLQKCLMNEKMLPFLDKFMVVLGRLLETPSRIEKLISRPANLDIDLRLLVTHSFRSKSLFNFHGIFNNVGRKSMKVKHILDYKSTEDIEWIHLLNSADRLVEWPNERISLEITHFSVHLFKRFLGESSSLIRSWAIELQSKANSTDSKISPFFNKSGQAKQLAGHFGKFVEKFFSNIIIKESLFGVQQRADKNGLLKKKTKKKDDDEKASKPFMSFLDDSNQQPEGTITIQPNQATKEILTCYQADADHGVELIVKFPDNYPISSVEVTHGKKTGVSKHQWKAWLVQLSVFLNHQNGSILDGIELWLRNIKKKFEGVEECVICTSIIHNKNFSMPKMQCRVCKKKFHQDCLYRWYASSDNPTCPMCRSLLTVN